MKIYIVLILIFVVTGMTAQLDSNAFKKDIAEVIDFGIKNVNKDIVKNDEIYYKNYLLLLNKSENLIYKYNKSDDVFLKNASIYFHQYLLSMLQIKGTFGMQVGTYMINRNIYSISEDSLRWHYFQYEKSLSKPIFDSINFSDDLYTPKDTNLSGKKYYKYFERLNFFTSIPKKSIFNSDNIASLNELSTTYDGEKTTKLLYLFIASCILTIILFFVTLKQLFKNKFQKKKIDEINTFLEHKNQEITDSINYSKRIQAAILPDISEIESNLKEVFVFYKPKDIVSGDFYYFNNVNADNFIAVADCTGHGVPGAFMSLVGSKELKIANSQSNSPAKILALLNNGVKETLKQNQIDGTKDGMDIALLKINGNKITYSGANRALWIVQKDAKEITEIKATKTAIAGHTEDNKVFEEHELDLNSGDCIYLSSDGYADQFGGDKQKKMTTKRFKDLLLSIQTKSMEEQQIAIEKYFIDWKGEIEQVDDILVIGIRIEYQ